jgi:hypothetical protein
VVGTIGAAITTPASSTGALGWLGTAIGGVGLASTFGGTGAGAGVATITGDGVAALVAGGEGVFTTTGAGAVLTLEPVLAQALSKSAADSANRDLHTCDKGLRFKLNSLIYYIIFGL